MGWASTPSANSRALSGRQRAQFRAEVFAAYGNRCFRCDRPAAVADHIVPIAQGGAHHVSNGQPLCNSCHDAKTQQESAAARKTKVRGSPRHPSERHPGLKG